MSVPRDGNGLRHPRKLIHFNTAGQAPADHAAMTFDEFFESDFAKRTTLAQLGDLLRVLGPSGELVEVEAGQLDGAALAWAVAIAEGREPILQAPCYGLPWRVAVMEVGRLIAWRPERDWLQTGPLLDQWAKSFGMVQDGKRETFRAFAYDHDHYFQRLGSGPSIQVAACRARVKVVCGDTVCIPAELVS